MRALVVLLLFGTASAAPAWDLRVGDELRVETRNWTHGKLRQHISSRGHREEVWRVLSKRAGVARVEVEVVSERTEYLSENATQQREPTSIGRRYHLDIDRTGTVVAVEFLGPISDAEPGDDVRRSRGSWQQAVVELPVDDRGGWTQAFQIPSLFKADLNVLLDFSRASVGDGLTRIAGIGTGEFSTTLAAVLVMGITHHERVLVFDFDAAQGLPRTSALEIQVEGELRVPQGKVTSGTARVERTEISMHMMVETRWRRSIRTQNRP